MVVGAAQVRGGPAQPVEPLGLVLQALHAAAGPELLAAVDAVHAVGIASWDYDELAARVARGIGAVPRHRVDTGIGGHWPVRLLEQAAARIAAGESQVAVVVGGEAAATVAALQRSGTDPVAAHGWTPAGRPAALDPADFGGPEQIAAGLLLPTRVYPLFENRLQADLGQTPAEAAAWSAALYADLTRVASTNPGAWSPQVRSAADIGMVTPANRLISEPYPLAVNAHPRVDQAAAVVLTSLAVARAHGVPEGELIHVWGGAGATDPVDLLRRSAYGSSAALTSCLTRTAALAPTPPGLVDVYSCFPVVPKLAGIALGLPRDSVLSVTGGHSAFGGPLSSYSLHAVVAARARLRAHGGSVLVHANGGFLTYQHAVLLGARPHPDGYVGDPEPVILPGGGTSGPIASGDVVVETATVERHRDGGAAAAFVIGLTAAGRRVAAATGDPAVAARLSLGALAPGVSTHVGRRVRVAARDGAAVVVDVL